MDPIHKANVLCIVWNIQLFCVLASIVTHMSNRNQKRYHCSQHASSQHCYGSQHKIHKEQCLLWRVVAARNEKKGQRWTQFVISFILLTELMPNGDGSFHQISQERFRISNHTFPTRTVPYYVWKTSLFSLHCLPDIFTNNINCTYVAITLNITLNVDQNYIVPKRTEHKISPITFTYITSFSVILYSLMRAT